MRAIGIAMVLVLMGGAAGAFAQVAVPNKPVRVIGESVPLSITVNGNGGVRWGAALCKPAEGKSSEICHRTLAKGQPVTLEARPSSGQSFAGWAGACQGQGLRCQLTPTAAISVAATFQPATADQTVTIEVQIPAAGGSVKLDTFVNAPINCSHTLAGYSGGTCKVTVPRGTEIDRKSVV